MNTSITGLLQLQTVDRDLFNLDSQINQLPETFKTIYAKIEQASLALENARIFIKKGQLEQATIESTLQRYAETLNKYKVQQATVRKNDEYVALIKSIDTIQADISNLETKGLMNLDTLELATSKFKEIETRINLEKLNLNQELKVLETLQSNFQIQKDEKIITYNQIRDQIPLAYLNVYLKVKSYLKRPPYIVLLESGLCSGCHLKLDYELIVEIKKQNQLTCCNHCKRIVILSQP